MNRGKKTDQEEDNKVKLADSLHIQLSAVMGGSVFTNREMLDRSGHMLGNAVALGYGHPSLRDEGSRGRPALCVMASL